MNSETAAKTRIPFSTGLKRIGGMAVVSALSLIVGLGEDSPVPSPAVAAPPSLPAPPANGELGFVSVQFHLAWHTSGEKIDCPDGLVGVLRDSYLRTVTAAERERLNQPENEVERERKWKQYALGPNNANVCAHILEFPDRPPVPMMKGPVQWGLNLDDDETGAGKDSYTCKHDNFTSPTGEKGIDNQLWRAQGCSQLNRGVAGDGNGDRRSGYDDNLKTGQYTQVLLLRGVNSLVNDPTVEVLYANTNDRPAMSSGGKPIFHGSYSVADGNKLIYRNVLKGKIVNGVLTTEPKHILLSEAGNGQRGAFDLDRARLRLEFQPDGSIKGLVGGYQPLLQLFGAARGGGLATVNMAGINCAGEYNTIKMLADGDKDPKTGKCRRISYAYELVAVPGFVNDVPVAQRTASR